MTNSIKTHKGINKNKNGKQRLAEGVVAAKRIKEIFFHCVASKKTPAFLFRKHQDKIKLPRLDDSRTDPEQEIKLFVSLYFRKKSSYIIYLDSSHGADNVPGPFNHKNIITEALCYCEILAKNPGRSYKEIGREFDASKDRVYKLINLIKSLPKNFITNTKLIDSRLLSNAISSKKLFKIAKLNSLKEREKELRRCLKKSGRRDLLK